MPRPYIDASHKTRRPRMSMLKRLSFVTEHPMIYRAWQAPFARAKFAPIFRHNDLSQVRRILDVGCGPGTNAPMFRGHNYVGLDFNEDYIESARRNHAGEFILADACMYTAAPEDRFDFILLNSLLHHINTPDVRRMLNRLAGQLRPDGHIHILDLVLPEQRSISRYLARSDRGDYPRPFNEWRRLFSEFFEPIVFEPYSVRWFGCSLWNMVYFKGSPRS
ncbi:class I SAM-dependent methyltransferase [bacterium]|nr:class I SAM-dependent methyltransferase [bacterium]